MKKGQQRLTLGMLSIMLVLILTACGTQTQPESTSNNTQQSQNLQKLPAETSQAAQELNTQTTEAPAVTTTAPETTNESEELQEMSIDPTKPMIALTFDDGPNLDTTPLVLDLLEEYDVKASFFLIGNNINMNNKKVIERTYELGCDIHNHSMTHSDMTKMSAEEIEKEITTVSNMIENITGEAPKFFRPPYISVNDTMYDTIDLTFICGYGCNDWEVSVTAENRAEKVLSQAKDGAIILLHDSSGNTQTVEALKTIIPSLLEDGYQLVTLTELFEAKGVELSAEDKNLYSLVE